MEQIASYPKIHNLGHRAIAELFNDPVVISEKVDGSQISFSVDKEGALSIRSKGAEIYVDAPEKMFTKAVESIKGIAGSMRPGWVYRGEYLRTPRHNVLTYDRVPSGHIALFDIEVGYGTQDWLAPGQVTEEAVRLGLDFAPVFFNGFLEEPDILQEFIERTSRFGNIKVEGVVIKNYHRFDEKTGKVLMGKLVREEFKETHAETWKRDNPNRNDVVSILIETYANENRWRKAIEHKRDSGQLEGAPEDIGPLIKEIQRDVKEEEKEAIKEALFRWAWPQIERGCVRGFPQWYKTTLAQGVIVDE